jgi:GT2 family glycosyltransferase
MTDDDAEVFPDWVTQMKQAHLSHPNAGALGGSVLGTDTNSLVSRISDLITFPSWKEKTSVRTLPGVNISYKRAALDKIGLQDETLFRGEDVDFNWRVLQAGWEILFIPEIKVSHHHRSTLNSLLRQHYMYGRGYYLVRSKWKEMYSIYPRSFRTPRDFLKAINSIAGVFYEPLLLTKKLLRWSDRLLALPLLFLTGLFWRLGMLVQRFKIDN